MRSEWLNIEEGYQYRREALMAGGRILVLEGVRAQVNDVISVRLERGGRKGECGP